MAEHPPTHHLTREVLDELLDVVKYKKLYEHYLDQEFCRLIDKLTTRNSKYPPNPPNARNGNTG